MGLESRLTATVRSTSMDMQIQLLSGASSPFCPHALEITWYVNSMLFASTTKEMTAKAYFKHNCTAHFYQVEG